MKRILHLVDSKKYIENNCFQSQLQFVLNEKCNLIPVELSEILNSKNQYEADGIISCLKQRTLYQNDQKISKWLNGKSIVVYDQDPWQAFMDDSPFKGAYDKILQTINVSSFAITTEWWVDFLKEKNIPAMFVKMWVLPQYCDESISYIERTKVAGFVGTVHPRRQKLIDIVESAGIHVDVGKNSYAYPDFLKEISKLRCFIHNEDMSIFVDKIELNFNTGMWVKDIEAAARGCFSIRSKAHGSENYLRNVETVCLYDTVDQVPDMIRTIEKMDPQKRQESINRSVQFIRSASEWDKTAEALITESTK